MITKKHYEKWCKWVDVSCEEPKKIKETMTFERYKTYIEKMIQYKKDMKNSLEA